MQNIDKVPVFGWVVFLILGVLAIAAISFLIVAFIRRGGKFSVLGQTIEVSEDGKVQTIDTLGLTYIMKENCDKIQSLTAERLEDVIPDISYLTSDISPLHCCVYRAEAILKKRILKNGFENLTADTVGKYILQLNEELYTHLEHEAGRAKLCAATQVPAIDKAKIEFIAKEFTRRAVRVYLLEVKSKAEMYKTYLPLFEKLGDKIRAGFCVEKKEKKERQTENLKEVVKKV